MLLLITLKLKYLKGIIRNYEKIINKTLIKKKNLLIWYLPYFLDSDNKMLQVKFNKIYDLQHLFIKQKILNK